MYLLGIKKWYNNWILMIIALGALPPLGIYMFYRFLKDIFTADNVADQCKAAEELYESELRNGEITNIKTQ